ncbi:unnamed protein product, partial [Didymodactylos carnosus]
MATIQLINADDSSHENIFKNIRQVTITKSDESGRLVKSSSENDTQSSTLSFYPTQNEEQSKFSGQNKDLIDRDDKEETGGGGDQQQSKYSSDQSITTSNSIQNEKKSSIHEIAKNENLVLSTIELNLNEKGDVQEQVEHIESYTTKKEKKDIDRNSLNSMFVHVGDLADADQLKYTTKIIHDCIGKSSKTQHIIEDFNIINDFRIKSKNVLDILARITPISKIFDYGERETGRKLLHLAAETDWYDGALFLLNRGVNINETDNENRSPLMECLASAETAVLKSLLKKRECNLDIQSLTGHTAAHYAVMMNKPKCLKIL